MPIQVLLNILIAFLWMFLQEQWSALSFIGGYIVGFIILFMIRRFLPTSFYGKKLIAIISLLLVFIRELVLSSITVTKQILQPKIKVTPGIFTIKTELEGELEVTLLSLLICLTPGSVVVEIAPDSKTLFVHAMDIPESSESVIKSQKIFEKAIKEVTR
ncbi:Na+/H+ antiporter subunit E [Mesobacillus maritimus]|uniref:Na+/H+ antiporter subunit E n=1 Tax=Mesobacillus maritimus TaxID=1643336 RepID=UPI00203BD443|nr:Na+/H+ antiporter subunit E [Mesobacillus maritimus]MCM3669740.1 Na+/H+ antiporter subunit E [Mesobacillus maritimus]